MASTKNTVIPNFTHLHVHSYYSLLDGLGSPKKLVAKAVKEGQKALALTDHGAMYGALEFYKECKKAGIKPIIGIEAYIAEGSRFEKNAARTKRYYHLILLAKNYQGYQSLLKMTTQAHLEGFYYKPRIDHELIKEHGKNLIISSGCLGGEVAQAISHGEIDKAHEIIKLYQSFCSPGDYYLEMQYNPGIPEQTEVNKQLIKFSKDLNIPIIATNDCHYTHLEDADAHDAFICIETKRTIDEKNRLRFLPDTYHLASTEEMMEYFKDCPQAIENTQEVVDKCNVEIELGVNKIPNYDTPDGKTPEVYLRELSFIGLQDRYGIGEKERKSPTPEHKAIIERLNYEMDTILKMGFPTYFLIVWDLIDWAKKQGIFVGPGRGSAAGSIVSYCLHITDLDPLKYGLLFERFLNPDRISMPDIDIDFQDDRRDEILEYVQQKYGKENVAQIITFGTLAARAAIRDCGRVLGVPYADVDRIAKMIPSKPGTKLDEALESEKELAHEYKNNPQTKLVIDYAKKLEGVVRHNSIHACAVVISEKPLTEYTALQAAAKGETSIVTQYSMKPIEDLGLLKMDFLGLKNLTILKNTVRIVKARRGIKIDINNPPLEDKATYEMLSRGDTIGVFQLESSGMRRYLKDLKPSTFEDIIAMVALYRPGPLNSGMVEEFIDRKHGLKEVSYPHQIMENALKNTYGVIVYQEQVMQLSKDMAGFTGGQADTLRKAMGKKIAELMEQMKEEFLAGCKKNNLPHDLAVQTFTDMEKFAEYGFNKSHAACYAYIAYQTAYLKAHFAPEFMAALMTADHGNTDRLTVEIQECADMKIDVLPPSVNESYHDFAVNKEGHIRFGMGAIKNIGDAPVEEIIKQRKKDGPYKDLADFLSRVSHEYINKKSIEALAMSGALDEFAERNAIISSMDGITSFAKQVQNAKESGQMDIFGVMDDESLSQTPSLTLADVEPADTTTRLTWEKELLGMFISDNPLNKIRGYFMGRTTPIKDLRGMRDDEKVKIGGMLASIKKIKTRKGDPMLFVTMEDLTSSTELVVFTRVLEKHQDVFEEGNIVIAEGKISHKDSEVKVLLTTIKKLDPDKLRIPKENKSLDQPLGITIPPGTNKIALEKLKKLLTRWQGSDKCTIKLPDDRTITLSTGVINCLKLQEEIDELLGVKV